MSPWLEISARTLAIGAAAVLLQLPLALLAARGLARRRFSGRPLLLALLTLPMFLPPVTVGLFLLILLVPRGPLGGLGAPLLYGPGAAVLAAAVASFPLLFRHALEALEQVPVRCLQVAATLGDRPSAVFWRVELPLARRGLGVGLLLAFARAVSEFGATAVLAGTIPGRTETLATGIYARLNVGDDAGALVLALVSLGIGVGAVLASERLLQR